MSKPQKCRKFKNNEPQTKFTGSFKKIVFFLLIINSKFIIAPTISKILSPLPLMLILDYISYTLKPFCIFSGEGKRVYKLIKYGNSFHIWISVCIIMFLYVYKLCERIHFTSASCTNVKCTQLFVKFCLIYQYQQAQLNSHILSNYG